MASLLAEIECLRTLDRLCVAARLTDRELARRRQAVYRVLDATEVVDATRPVLARAARPMPTALGTLDAIPLATALLWREWRGADPVFATHDATRALAVHASELAAVGVPA